MQIQTESEKRALVTTRRTRIGTRLSCLVLILGSLTLSSPAQSSKPVAQLPNAYLDTSWKLPNGGTTWAAHDVTQFRTALTSSAPGDVIVLDAGVTYSGSFTLPAKSNPNNKWIYIISSQLANLPAGTRVSPANAIYMPKLVHRGCNPDYHGCIRCKLLAAGGTGDYRRFQLSDWMRHGNPALYDLLFDECCRDFRCDGRPHIRRSGIRTWWSAPRPSGRHHNQLE